MDSVQRVMQRITSIETRFQRITPASSATFAQTLNNVGQQYNQQLAANQSHGDIENIVRAAAAKHNVDPRLALAVAVTESNLEPNAVSPVGAVGVMQLMPETAQGLGVRNINDPRENIDGGVRYLKQMLNTFNGDVTKAVAAYNAGPDAVSQYNGVPPYAETRAYVNKVLALSR
jgi:soluble lytic murein transglycosylase-like protein